MFSDDHLRALQRGEPRGLEAAFAAFGDRVYRLSRNVLGDATEAEDATQEVFLRVCDKAAQFDRRAAFGTWLYRLTVNHCLNLRKARARRLRALVAVDPSDLPLESDDRGEHRHDAREELDVLLAQLPDDARAMIVLREIEGLSYAEIAAVLGVPVGTVMSRLSRARVKLNEVARRDGTMQEATER